MGVGGRRREKSRNKWGPKKSWTTTATAAVENIGRKASLYSTRAEFFVYSFFFFLCSPPNNCNRHQRIFHSLPFSNSFLEGDHASRDIILVSVSPLLYSHSRTHYTRLISYFVLKKKKTWGASENRPTCISHCLYSWERASKYGQWAIRGCCCRAGYDFIFFLFDFWLLLFCPSPGVV